MLLSVNSINCANQVSSVRNANQIGKVAFKANTDESRDTVELSARKELTFEDKQKMVKNARKKAAGWSIFGGLFSALYYGLRSDEKIARKFDLDVEKDKALIKQIKQDQTIYALTGFVGYILACSQNAEDMPVR